MAVKSERRRLSTVEQNIIHGDWEVTKVYVRGELNEIVVRRRRGLAQ